MSTLPSFESRLFLIEGQVQGVGYRDHCAEQARRLHLAGWVRNRRDGSVELMLQGPAGVLDQTEAWLRAGPRWAHVERVTQKLLPASTAALDRFERRPTE